MLVAVLLLYGVPDLGKNYFRLFVYDKRIKREDCLVEVLKRQRLVLMIYVISQLLH